MTDQQRDALQGALAFHAHRDMMNAAAHTDPVRWSPLTRELAQALDAIEKDVLAPATEALIDRIVGTA